MRIYYFNRSYLYTWCDAEKSVDTMDAQAQMEMYAKVITKQAHSSPVQFMESVAVDDRPLFKGLLSIYNHILNLSDRLLFF